MKQVFKIGNSEQLNASAAVLLAEFGEMHCCMAVVDYTGKTLHHLIYYTMDEDDNGHALQHILNEHPEFKGPFHQTIIGYYMPENILMPAKLFRYE